MIFDCPPDTIGINCTPNAGISTFNFTSGKIHRLRLINAGAEALQRFTIDDHEMTIIANGTRLTYSLDISLMYNTKIAATTDFVPVQPYKTNVVTLGAGQRTDILVTANGQPTDAVFMRSNISAKCTGGSQPLALAAIFYEAANRTAAPNSLATDYDDSICGNVSLLVAASTNSHVEKSSSTHSSDLLLRILSRRPYPCTPMVPVDQRRRLKPST